MTRCHCGRVGLYMARAGGAVYCQVHRYQAAEVSRAISRAHAQAYLAELHNYREGHLHDPVSQSRRWR